jgi:hypothetical protein
VRDAKAASLQRNFCQSDPARAFGALFEPPAGIAAQLSGSEYNPASTLPPGHFRPPINRINADNASAFIGVHRWPPQSVIRPAILEDLHCCIATRL